jgi:hypothetical protein
MTPETERPQTYALDSAATGINPLLAAPQTQSLAEVDKMTVFCDTAPCSLVEVDRRFRDVLTP